MHDRAQRRAVGLLKLHRGRSLDAEVVALRPADAPVGEPDVPEQTQVAARADVGGQHRDPRLGGDREAAARHQRTGGGAGTADGVALAVVQLGQADFAGEVGHAAEDGFATRRIDDLDHHVGQIDDALRRRTAPRRREEKVVRRLEAQSAGRAGEVGDRRCGMAHGRALGHRGAKCVRRDGVLLFDVATAAVGDGHVSEMQTGPVGHGPDGFVRVAVLDTAGGDAPLVLQRIAIGVAGLHPQVGLVRAAGGIVAGTAAATDQQQSHQGPDPTAGAHPAEQQRVTTIHARQFLLARHRTLRCSHATTEDRAADSEPRRREGTTNRCRMLRSGRARRIPSLRGCGGNTPPRAGAL